MDEVDAATAATAAAPATAASAWSDAARVAPGTVAGRVVGTAAVRGDRRREAADATVGAIGAAARATVTAARRGVGRVAPARAAAIPGASCCLSNNLKTR